MSAEIRELMGDDLLGGGLFIGRELQWQKKAACAKAPTKDAERFFPGGGAPSQKSKRFCAGCPVRDECLDWALAHEEQGIWGGLQESEREALLVERMKSVFTLGETA